MVDFHTGTNFVTHSGIEVTEANSEKAVGRLEVRPHHHQPYGVVHGGVYCTLVETLASTGAALWALDQGMAGCVGVHNATDFLRPVREGVLGGEATPVHRGRTQQLWMVTITRQEDGKEVARGQVRLQNLTDPSMIGGLEPRS
ncbi:MAG: PaaI family thioesterase [Actinomycetota bacterium]